MSRRGGRGSSPWLLPTVLLFVVIPLAGAVAVAVGGSDDGDGASDGPVLLPRRTPLAYSVTYDVEDTTQERPTRTVEVLEVRRPFESRLSVRDASGRVLNERASRLGALATRGADGRWRELALGPALPTGDLRPGPALEDALARGWIQARGRRELLGRRCQVFRAGGSVSAGTLHRLRPGGRDFADACIDGSGIVLEETWHIGGRRVQRRVATWVDDRATLESSSLAPPTETERIGPDQGGGSSVLVRRDGLPPGFFLDLSRPPNGFRHEGRFAVVPPKVDVGRNPLSPSNQAVSTAIADVWARGPDILVVEQGTVSDPNLALPEPTEPVDVDLGTLGRGTGYIDLRTSEVRAPLPAGAFVRVYGTLSLRELTAVAKALQPRTDGTGLVPVQN